MTDRNKQIFSTTLRDSLSHKSMNPYQEEMRNLSIELLKKYCVGKIILDIGCGTGEYTFIAANIARKVVGIDFSDGMLKEFKKRIVKRKVENITLILSDARQIGLKDCEFDVLYSFATLYYVNNVKSALCEMYRVLKPGGYAIFSLGNLWSINTLLCRNASSGVVSYHISPGNMIKHIKASGLKIINRRCFQLFPMYGGKIIGFRGEYYLTRFITMRGSFELRLFSKKINGKMLDEIISS